jgi:polyhydroxyalkanoate synthesis regulator protein
MTPIFIKRYRNRKLYRPDVGAYTSLQEIFTLIRANRPIIVIDHDKRDITRKVLAQVFVETRQYEEIPEDILRNLLTVGVPQ